MIDRTLRAAAIGAVLLGMSQSAAAQGTPWEDRVFASFSFGVEGGSDVSDSRSFTVYGETATVEANTSYGADALVDFSVGARVWRNLGVAIGYHTKSSTATTEITGSVPHPIFFDRPRSFSVSADGIDRDEHATYLQIGWMVPLTDKVDVFIYGGPSFFRVSQELVTDIAVGEEGPPFTNIVVQPTFGARKKSATGYNVGADVTYILYTTDSVRLGLGGYLRITGATADIPLMGETVSTDLGGVQFGVGARFRF